jgi:hypothetical protein
MCQWDRREALFGCLGLVFSLGVSGLLAYAAVLALRARRKNLPQPPDGHHERPEPPFDREP